MKSRFAKRVEDALVRQAVSVTVTVEEVRGTLERLGEGGDDAECQVVCTRLEYGPDAAGVGSFLGDTILSPKRREGDVRKLWRLGWGMPVESSSSKTEGNGSSSPSSVTQTARRGSGRGAKRIRRLSGAELRLER